MKKLLFAFSFLLASQCIAMNELESAKETDINEKIYQATYRKMLGNIPDEILEKIFTYVNHETGKPLIEEISKIKVGIRYTTDDSLRQFDDEKFEKISEIIKNAPIFAYTRIALSIALSRVFSKYEKLHFLGIMLVDKHLTQKQKLIFKFLAERVREFEPHNVYRGGFTSKKTQAKDFMISAFNLMDIDEMELIMKFLFNNGIHWPEDTIGQLINTKNKHIIPLVRFALNNGASVHGSVYLYKIEPLDYCSKMLACWNDENWLEGPESEDERLKIAPIIGGFGVVGYSKNFAPDTETIKYNIEYYEELIKLLSSHLPKKYEQNDKEQISECAQCEKEAVQN